MGLLGWIVIFCVFLVGIHSFSLWYIQFIYRKAYVEHKQDLDTVLMFGSVPDRWRRSGKDGCIRRLRKLKSFVAHDTQTPAEEKENLQEELDDLLEQWQASDPDFFAVRS